jgi:hypothetical protein
VAKLLQELPQQKRDGNTIARTWANELAFDREKSTSQACALLGMLEFIPALSARLKTDPEGVIADMEDARRSCKFPSFHSRQSIRPSAVRL